MEVPNQARLTPNESELFCSFSIHPLSISSFSSTFSHHHSAPTTCHLGFFSPNKAAVFSTHHQTPPSWFSSLPPTHFSVYILSSGRIVGSESSFYDILLPQFGRQPHAFDLVSLSMASILCALQLVPPLRRFDLLQRYASAQQQYVGYISNIIHSLPAISPFEYDLLRADELFWAFWFAARGYLPKQLGLSIPCSPSVHNLNDMPPPRQEESELDASDHESSYDMLAYCISPPLPQNNRQQKPQKQPSWQNVSSFKTSLPELLQAHRDVATHLSRLIHDLHSACQKQCQSLLLHVFQSIKTVIYSTSISVHKAISTNQNDDEKYLAQQRTFGLYHDQISAIVTNASCSTLLNSMMGCCLIHPHEIRQLVSTRHVSLGYVHFLSLADIKAAAASVDHHQVQPKHMFDAHFPLSPQSSSSNKNQDTFLSSRHVMYRSHTLSMSSDLDFLHQLDDLDRQSIDFNVLQTSSVLPSHQLEPFHDIPTRHPHNYNQPSMHHQQQQPQLQSTQHSFATQVSSQLLAGEFIRQDPRRSTSNIPQNRLPQYQIDLMDQIMRYFERSVCQFPRLLCVQDNQSFAQQFETEPVVSKSEASGPVHLSTLEHYSSVHSTPARQFAVPTARRCASRGLTSLFLAQVNMAANSHVHAICSHLHSPHQFLYTPFDLDRIPLFESSQFVLSTPGGQNTPHQEGTYPIVSSSPFIQSRTDFIPLPSGPTNDQFDDDNIPRLATRSDACLPSLPSIYSRHDDSASSTATHQQDSAATVITLPIFLSDNVPPVSYLHLDLAPHSSSLFPAISTPFSTRLPSIEAICKALQAQYPSHSADLSTSSHTIHQYHSSQQPPLLLLIPMYELSSIRQPFLQNYFQTNEPDSHIRSTTPNTDPITTTIDSTPLVSSHLRYVFPKLNPVMQYPCYSSLSPHEMQFIFTSICLSCVSNLRAGHYAFQHHQQKLSRVSSSASLPPALRFQSSSSSSLQTPFPVVLSASTSPPSATIDYHSQLRHILVPPSATTGMIDQSSAIIPRSTLTSFFSKASPKNAMDAIFALVQVYSPKIYHTLQTQLSQDLIQFSVAALFRPFSLFQQLIALLRRSRQQNRPAILRTNQESLKQPSLSILMSENGLHTIDKSASMSFQSRPLSRSNSSVLSSPKSTIPAFWTAIYLNMAYFSTQLSLPYLFSCFSTYRSLLTQSQQLQYTLLKTIQRMLCLQADIVTMLLTLQQLPYFLQFSGQPSSSSSSSLSSLSPSEQFVHTQHKYHYTMLLFICAIQQSLQFPSLEANFCTGENNSTGSFQPNNSPNGSLTQNTQPCIPLAEYTPRLGSFLRLPIVNAVRVPIQSSSSFFATLTATKCVQLLGQLTRNSPARTNNHLNSSNNAESVTKLQQKLFLRCFLRGQPFVLPQSDLFSTAQPSHVSATTTISDFSFVNDQPPDSSWIQPEALGIVSEQDELQLNMHYNVFLRNQNEHIRTIVHSIFLPSSSSSSSTSIASLLQTTASLDTFYDQSSHIQSSSNHRNQQQEHCFNLLRSGSTHRTVSPQRLDFDSSFPFPWYIYLSKQLLYRVFQESEKSSKNGLQPSKPIPRMRTPTSSFPTTTTRSATTTTPSSSGTNLEPPVSKREILNRLLPCLHAWLSLLHPCTCFLPHTVQWPRIVSISQQSKQFQSAFWHSQHAAFEYRLQDPVPSSSTTHLSISQQLFHSPSHHDHLPCSHESKRSRFNHYPQPDATSANPAQPFLPPASNIVVANPYPPRHAFFNHQHLSLESSDSDNNFAGDDDLEMFPNDFGSATRLRFGAVGMHVGNTSLDATPFHAQVAIPPPPTKPSHPSTRQQQSRSATPISSTNVASTAAHKAASHPRQLINSHPPQHNSSQLLSQQEDVNVLSSIAVQQPAVIANNRQDNLVQQKQQQQAKDIQATINLMNDFDNGKDDFDW